jgi:hypothetical protein
MAASTSCALPLAISNDRRWSPPPRRRPSLMFSTTLVAARFI